MCIRDRCQGGLRRVVLVFHARRARHSVRADERGVELAAAEHFGEHLARDGPWAQDDGHRARAVDNGRLDAEVARAAVEDQGDAPFHVAQHRGRRRRARAPRDRCV